MYSRVAKGFSLTVLIAQGHRHHLERRIKSECERARATITPDAETELGRARFARLPSSPNVAHGMRSNGIGICLHSER